MARKKKEETIEEVINLPEFGFIAKDSFNVMLVLESNSALDKHKYLEKAKKLDRPILFQIESDLFDTYKYTNFAMTLDEAKGFHKELGRMIEHLEE